MVCFELRLCSISGFVWVFLGLCFPRSHPSAGTGRKTIAFYNFLQYNTFYNSFLQGVIKAFTPQGVMKKCAHAHSSLIQKREFRALIARKKFGHFNEVARKIISYPFLQFIRHESFPYGENCIEGRRCVYKVQTLGPHRISLLRNRPTNFRLVSNHLISQDASIIIVQIVIYLKASDGFLNDGRSKMTSMLQPTSGQIQHSVLSCNVQPCIDKDILFSFFFFFIKY